MEASGNGGRGPTQRSQRQRRLVQATLAALAEQPTGALPVRTLFETLAERLQLGPDQVAMIPGTTQRLFERDAYFGLIPATKAGWLKREKGVWTLTESGREAVQKYRDPDTLQKAARDGFQEWKKTRPATAQTTPTDDLDRHDPEAARRVFEALYPDDSVRESCMGQAATSIAMANEVAPAAWSATLFPRKVNVLVGRIFVVSFTPGKVELIADENSLDQTTRPSAVDIAPFEVKLPNLVQLTFPAAEMDTVGAWAAVAHEAAVRAAAGSVSRNPYRRSFSAGITSLLRDEAGLDVADPETNASDVDVPRDLDDALASFDRDQARATAAKGDAARRAIVDQFPLASWPDLPLERYALGSQSRESFCYLMEFGSDEFGSMRGGSALKHAIYRKSDGGWYFEDTYPTVEAAWDVVRGAFVEAFSLAAAGNFEAVDDLRPLRSAAALRTKALYLYFPDEMLPIYSSAYLAHFINLLGGPTGQRDTVEANRSLLKLMRERPEFEGWSTHEMGQFLIQWASPRKAGLVVKVAPGERAAFWDECREGGYICISWDELGDLSRFATQEEFRRAFDEAFRGEYQGNKSKLTVKANEVWTFRQLQPGDTVIANRGTGQVVGIGTVTEPGYAWHPERSELKHTVAVRWTDTTERTLDPPVTSWFGSTVAKVPGDLYRRITAGSAAIPEGTQAAVSPEYPLTEIRDGLQRRGQVVLYGPPGTGKTYAARRFSVWWLLARAGSTEADWILGDPSALARREKELADAAAGVPQLSRVTFHPSYSYEDFVEGYKPKPTEGRGGLELELRDGIFKRVCAAAGHDPSRPYLLLIDEINRGNVPKILGELITLLELDKRDINVILPYSGQPFAIPKNVFVIGTMNTADRSIRMLDAALRRRFAFIELPPNPEVLQGATVDRLALDAFLLELNQRILRNVGREKQIGHSFFLDKAGKPITTSEDFVGHFLSEVLPILQEYAFEDYSLLAQILGEGIVDSDQQTIRSSVIGEPAEFVEALRKSFGTTE